MITDASYWKCPSSLCLFQQWDNVFCKHWHQSQGKPVSLSGTAILYTAAIGSCKKKWRHAVQLLCNMKSTAVEVPMVKSLCAN